MFNFKTLSVSALALMLAACVSSGGGYLDDGPTPEGQLLGDFLAGQYAEQIHDSKARSEYFSSAFSRAPDNRDLGSNAIKAALSFGNEPLARTLAIEMETLDPAEPMGRLVLSASEMAKGRYALAAERLHTQPDDASLGVMMAFLEAWAEYGAGNTETALDIFSSIERGGYFEIMARLQKAKIYAREGRIDEARASFDIVEKSGLSRIQTALAKTEFLAANGNAAQALAYLEGFDLELGGVESGPIRSMINRLSAGESVSQDLSAAQYASASLIDPAGAFFAQQRVYEVAEIYLRTALILDSDNYNARLWLGTVLERMERTTEAEAIYDSVPKSSDYSVSARLSHANLLFRDEQDVRAISMLETLAKDHPIYIAREALGTAYLIREDYEKALPYYDALVASLSQEDLQQDPNPLYYRGICLEQLDRWDEAERDFKAVLAIDPENADVLNYLGYTWVDRGENLTEAFDMIRKAVELEPDSGAIIDSLGWAHYKLGQYSDARIHLEDATEKSPGSATIVDHLGDVYWKLGRFREAGYQWERALTLDPTDKERAAIELKLKGGFDSVQAAP